MSAEIIPFKIPEFSKEHFLETEEPFAFAYQFSNDKFTLERILTRLSEQAMLHKIRNFKAMYMGYVSVKNKASNKIDSNITEFEGQEKTLISGKWIANDLGVSFLDNFGQEQYACVHPITIEKRLVNIDTGIEKLKIAFHRGNKKWKTIIPDRKTLASANKIVELSEHGIAVNSENAKYLVQYLHDLEHENYDMISETNCCSRLGWIKDEGFAPYVSNLEFDGDITYKTFFESVRPKGTFEEWISITKDVRKNITTRLILAASFASVLIEKFNALPFFVHLWGATEVGKTVGLMLAVSVWANPEHGRYMQSFNSTAVGMERMAGFFNNLPLIMDELELQKDKKQFDKEIYMLCEGIGKARGNKNGTIEKPPTWKNCILTSGERPITSESSGGGAQNRIIEIECDENLFDNFTQFCEQIKENYGTAGRKFVEFYQQNEDSFKKIQKSYSKKFEDFETTKKQALAMSMILTADEVISKLFYNSKPLEVSEVANFLKTKQAVSSGARAYDFLCDWVIMNHNKFVKEENIEGKEFTENVLGEICGKIFDGKAYIIKTVFDRVLSEQGYSGASVLSYFRKNNLIQCQDKNTVTIRISGKPVRCVALILPLQ